MNIGLGFLLIVVVIVVVGSGIQTYYPTLISKELSDSFSAITLAFVGILVSIATLMIFLKLNNREGFEDVDFVTRWKTIASDNKFKEVCDLYTEIYDKILTVEKGAPPEQLTDAQAREKTDKRFADLMKVKPIPCKPVMDSLNVTTLNELFEVLPTLPNTICQQSYETALACRSLLIENVNRVDDAQNQRQEAFEDVPICSEEVAEKRRALKAAETCRLPEEVPADTKEEAIRKKLEAIESECKKVEKKETLETILEDCKRFKDELDAKAKEAEDLSNRFNFS